MNLLAVLLFVLTSSIDNFTVALAYGVKRIRIGTVSNLVIAFVSSIGTLISMATGKLIGSYISPSLANLLGSLLLFLIGIWFIIDYVKSKKYRQANVSNEFVDAPNCMEILEYPEIADLDHSGTIDFKESFTLAVALAINNVGIGIGGSIIGLNVLLTSSLTFIFSLVLIPLGILVGRGVFSKFFGTYSSLISAIILIAISIFELPIK